MKAIAQKGNALIDAGKEYDIDVMQCADGYLTYRVWVWKPYNPSFDIDYLTLAYYFGHKNADSIKYGCLKELEEDDAIYERSYY